MRLSLPTHPLVTAGVAGGAMLAAAFGAVPASAAAQRYASPSGSGTACTSAAPCSITQAITAASSGDEVIVEPGDYPLTASLSTPGSITIHGVAGQPRPRLQFSGAGQGGLRVNYSTLRYVEVDQSSTDWALLGFGATVEQVVASGPWGAEIQGGTLLRDSVVVASGTNAAALEAVVNGATLTSSCRNVTAIATGSGGIGIEARGLGATGNVTINATNVIARSTNGPALEAVTDSSGAHATITVDHSNFPSPLTVGTNAVVNAGAGNQTAPPGFVDAAAGDYREAPGSPTIDAGIDDPLNGTLDFEGDPRTVGTTDIGADEYAAPTNPAPDPAPAPSGTTTSDTTAPGLTLTAPKKEFIRKGRVYLFATSSKAVSGAASGKVSVPKLAKSYRLRPTTKALAANTRTKITLKVPAKTLRAARSALARHQRVKATLVVRVKDEAGNTTSKQLRVRLTK